MAAFSYKINYTGNSKIIRRIVDKLNNLAPLGIEHDQAFYGDWGNEAYLHSHVREGNPHNVNLEDLGIAMIPRQVEMVMDAVGSLDYWVTHNAAEVENFVDHEGDMLIFASASRLLAWH